jgi:hypothetical protein
LSFESRDIEPQLTSPPVYTPNVNAFRAETPQPPQTTSRYHG